MVSIKPRLCFLMTTLFIGVVVCQSNDNESKVNAPTASKPPQQQDQGELGTKQQQPAQPQSSPELSYPDSVPFYNPSPDTDDKSDSILIPIDFASQNLDQFNDVSESDIDDVSIGEGEAADSSEVGELKDEDDKRYAPRFIGKRYHPRFVGKRYTPRFVGKRYTPRFVGKRYSPRFVGKRYSPRFVGKRYAPRFIGRKREAEQTNDEAAAAHTIEKRSVPRFVGKRQVQHEPFGPGWLLDDDEGYGDKYNSGDADEDSRGCQDDASAYGEKRGAPRFIGKRAPPRFVGKRGVPRFIGKRFRPRFVGRRGAPRFVGKRGVPRFIGKRADDIDDDDYIFQWESFNDVLDKRGAPRFVGKKSIYNDMTKDRLQDRKIRDLLSDWSRALAIENDKRWTSPVTPSFIGKRMESISSQFER